MDIWEANARSTSIAPHTCSKKGVYLCQGAECEQEGGVCDKIGCAWNPYRNKAPNSYGNSAKFKVDTTRPFDVVTQFHADRRGKLNRIYRLYVQGGKVIQTQTVNVPGLPKTDALNDDFCKATGSSRYLELGGTVGMGDALSRGMVLAMSIWWDEGGNMNWLDSGDAGPCRADEGSPANIQLVQPKPEVTFSNMRWGEIGSTFSKN
jgi:cellulase